MSYSPEMQAQIKRRLARKREKSGSGGVAASEADSTSPSTSPPDPAIAWVRAAVEATGVTERTAYRWHSGESQPHPAARRLLDKAGL